MAGPRESSIEGYLVRGLESMRASGYHNRVKKIGGPGWRGWNDRMILWQGGYTHWIEMKRPKGGKFEPLQLRVHRDLRQLGFVVRVLHTREAVDDYLADVQNYWGDGLHLIAR